MSVQGSRGAFHTICGTNHTTNWSRWAHNQRIFNVKKTLFGGRPQCYSSGRRHHSREKGFAVDITCHIKYSDKPHHGIKSIMFNDPVISIVSSRKRKTKRPPIWQLRRNWWECKLSLRQLTVPPVTKKLSNWWSVIFSVKHPSFRW